MRISRIYMFTIQNSCVAWWKRRAHIPKVDGSKPSTSNPLFFFCFIPTFPLPHDPFPFYTFDNHLPLVSTTQPSRKPNFHLCRIDVSLAAGFCDVSHFWVTSEIWSCLRLVQYFTLGVFAVSGSYRC